MKRPLLAGTVFYILGIIIFDLFGLEGIALSSIILLAIVFVPFFKHKVYLAMLGLIFVLGGLYYGYKVDSINSALLQYQGKKVTVEGMFIEGSSKDNRYTAVINAEKINNNAMPQEKVRVEVYNNIKEPKYGDKVKVSGIIEKPSEERNPGGFNYRRYLISKNIYSIIKCEYFSMKDENKGNRFIALSMNMKEKMLGVIHNLLPKNEALLLAAVVLSKTDTLDEQVKTDFSNSGLSHIMAVSGMNVALIVIPLLYTSKKLKIPKLLYIPGIAIILIMFAFITGGSAAVVRAVIMSMVVIIGEAIYRDNDTLTCIAFSAVLILVYNPVIFFDVGFQLSYAATLGIVMLQSRIADMFKTLPKILGDTISVTLSAQVGVIPIICYYFNKISIISLFSNIIAAPIAQGILIIGLVMSLIGQASIFLAKFLSGIIYFLVKLLYFIANKSCLIPFAWLTVSTPSIYQIAAYYLIIIGFLLYSTKEFNQIKLKCVEKLRPYYAKLISRKKLMVGLGTAIVIFFVLSIYNRPLQISYIDVGQGDSAFIQTPNNKIILVDCGTGNRQDPGKDDKIIVPFLLDKGIRKIDIIVVSHPDSDHISSMESIADKFKVGSIMVSKGALKSENWRDIEEIAKKNNIKIAVLNSGTVNISKNVNIEAISMGEEVSINDSSLSVMLNYKNNKFLFCGDISKEAEAELIKKYNLKADVLKIAHHGSKNSSSEDFLNKVNPKVAVISVGKNNYGHPSSEVVSRLENIKAKVLRTDKKGCITMISNGKSIKIRSMIGDKVHEL